jgi:hypothetical protein
MRNENEYEWMKSTLAVSSRGRMQFAFALSSSRSLSCCAFFFPSNNFCVFFASLGLSQQHAAARDRREKLELSDFD